LAHPVAVADAGGLFTLAGLVEGVRHEVDEVLALDTTTLLAAEYVALRHEGAPQRAHAEYGLLMRVVGEWFPVRPLALDAVLAAEGGTDVDSYAALVLAESLEVPVVTRHEYLRSERVPVLRC
jgi:hypothetical protein